MARQRWREKSAARLIKAAPPAALSPPLLLMLARAWHTHKMWLTIQQAGLPGPRTLTGQRTARAQAAAVATGAALQ